MPPGLTDDGVVVAGERSSLDFGLHVHGYSPFVELGARAEARAAGVNERWCCGSMRDGLP